MENLESQFLEKKCCVLIPTYNNGLALKKVLDEVIKVTHQVLIINDGSTDNTPLILSEYKNIHIHTKPKNEGKGMALRDGFKLACELGYDFAISMDSDGQHYATDLKQFIHQLPEHANAIIIGARNLDQNGVPKKSNFGNRFSNFWFKVETGISLADTQSGYRLYPIRKLNDFFWITPKYEFEIEVIVRAAWAGMEVFCIPIEVYYPPQQERISHFRPFQDFTRISVLNTFLVLITFFWIKPRNLFQNIFRKSWKQLLTDLFADPNEPDFVKAASAGFGLFMGIFPVWGFQLLLGLTICQLTKMNKALFILFANISFPVFIPIIIWISHSIGAYFVSAPTDFPLGTNLKLEDIPNLGQQYLVGSIVFSILAGITGFSSALAALKLSKGSRKQTLI